MQRIILMSLSNKARALLLAICGLFILTGCSMRSEGTTEAKLTAASVSAQYLSYILQGKLDPLYSFLSWDDFLINSGGISRDQFIQQVQQIRALPLDASHPLFGLKLKEVEVIEDSAEVEFVKENGEGDEVLIKLFWGGRAWIITGDSLFGPNKTIAKAVAKAQEHKVHQSAEAVKGASTATGDVR